MSIRALIIVAAMLVVLTVVALLGQRTPGDPNRADAIFAPELRARFDDIESIVIRKGGNEVVATLNQTPDGWTVAERSGYPADTAKIRAALTALADARVIEEKTANPELYGRLGLADLTNPDSRGISVTVLPEDPRTPAMILGDSEGTSYRYARLAGVDQSYLINADPDLPSNTVEWLLPGLLDVRGERIERIVISHADGETLEIFKTDVGQSNYTVADIPDGRELQYPGVANVIGNTLRDLRLEDVAAIDTATAPEPEVVTEFTTFDGLIVRAEGLRVDDESWLVFSARVDAEFADGPGADDGIDNDAASSADAATSEAETINARAGGWRFRIPSYQYSQIARRMTDMLRTEESTN